MDQRPVPAWDTLTFALTEPDAMYTAAGDMSRDPVWTDGVIEPYGPIALAPAAAVLSYGVGIFEGLKAFRRGDGSVGLFRPEMNAARFGRSARRLMMEPFPEARFLDAVDRLVDANRRLVPPSGQGSFYIRPMQFAHEAKLGSGPCRAFTVVMYGSPVGQVRAKGDGGLRLRVVGQARVAPGGTGGAKAIGNYAGGVLVAEPWRRAGFDDVLYVDAREGRWVTETNGANIFARLRDGRLVTPPIGDQIMPGVTRDSVIAAADRVLGLRVDERPLALDELLDDATEVFCTGTAWTVRGVREIAHRDRLTAYRSQELCARLWEIISGVQYGRCEDSFRWTRVVPQR